MGIRCGLGRWPEDFLTNLANDVARCFVGLHQILVRPFGKMKPSARRSGRQQDVPQSNRAWQIKPTRENWLELKDSVAIFDAYRLKIVSYPREYTEVWFPGHGTFCKWLTANLDDTSVAFYVPWETRKAVVLKRGIKGTAMGFGQSYYYSFIKEPLTLDFSKEP